MEAPEVQKQKVADFLQTLISPGRLNLKFNILACNGQVQPNASESAGAVEPVPASTKKQPSSSSSDSQICVEFTGPDVSLLLARNGELLLAMEHVAAKILRFEHEEHDRISFDANNYKLLRHQELRMAAEAAIERVRRTGQPFAFAPMSSRERRLLHLELAASGLPTASSGEGARRFVVLYPEGEAPPPAPSKDDRAQAIRQRFRRR
ncbi:Jag family protein [Edaphobacter flagellatus]|uniref:Jag family protein n=1 Tax=Edaphobacter flagellatus TaxID=1933044 RepID=UPI0021B346A3|nr:R3H domain-containing nucleic acid-binding protein [Edaphobacter flagellatus]